MGWPVLKRSQQEDEERSENRINLFYFEIHESKLKTHALCKNKTIIIIFKKEERYVRTVLLL